MKKKDENILSSGVYQNGKMLCKIKDYNELLYRFKGDFRNLLKEYHIQEKMDLTVVLPSKLGELDYTTRNSLEIDAKRVFHHCPNIKELNEENSPVMINAYACDNLETVILPSDLTEFHSVVLFENCKGLKNLYIDKDNRYYTSVNGALYNKDVSALVFYPGKNESEIDERTDSIYAFAFTLVRKDKIAIPFGITHLFENALTRDDYNFPRKIYLPDTIRYIDDEFIKPPFNEKEEMNDTIFCSKEIATKMPSVYKDITVVATLDNLLEKNLSITEINNIMKETSER